MLVLSAKTDKHFQVLVGVMLAFLCVDGIAIAAGSWVTTIVPPLYLKLVSGIVFLVLGVILLVRKRSDEEQVPLRRNVLLSGFLLVFLTEWGDKTQIAAALFAVRYNTYLVLAGTLAALAVLSAMAVFFGRLIAQRVDARLLAKVSGVLFIVIGLVILVL